MNEREALLKFIVGDRKTKQPAAFRDFVTEPWFYLHPEHTFLKICTWCS